MKIICVDGNISAGKSTLIQAFRKRYQAECNKFQIVMEPVEQFQKWKSYNPLMFNYTEGNNADIAIAQMHILETLKCAYREAINKSSAEQTTLICERSIYSPNIFVETFYNEGVFSQFCCDYLQHQCNQAISELGISKLGADKIFFLDRATSDCVKRVKSRGRKEELNPNYPLLKHLSFLNTNYAEYLNQFRKTCGPENLFVTDSSDLDFLCKRLYHFAEL
jgi:deoxyadenosine/deoxycytidine kinase